MFQSQEEIFSPHLDRDERLLWSGQPSSDIRLRVQDAFLIPFSILWCGFAIFWEVIVNHSGASFIFKLWCIPFVYAGLLFISGRFIDARSRGRTIYRVTSGRILIVSGLFSQQTKSLQLRTLTYLSLTQHRVGSGTITFRPTNYLNSFSRRAGAWPGIGRDAPPSFDL